MASFTVSKVLSYHGLSNTFCLCCIISAASIVTGPQVRDVEADYCSRYKTWSSCVQDPCSRTGKSPSWRQCSYCSKGISTFCAALNVTSVYCNPGSVAVQGKCQPMQQQGKDHSCVLKLKNQAITFNFTHNFVIEGSTPSDGGIQFYAIGLCHNVMSTRTCSEHSQCQAPILLRGGSQTDPCWTLGNITAMKTYFVSSNLSSGVVIDYGATHCCPLGSSDPGITRKLQVQLLILPDCSSGEDWTVHHVPSIDLLKNCSLATKKTFQIQLKSRQLCSENNHVLWKLSHSLSTLKCVETTTASGNTLQCQFYPVWDSGKAVHHTSRLCQRLQVQELYKYRLSRENMTRAMEASALPCSFVVKMTEYLIGVGVMDYDGSLLGDPFSTSVHHRQTHVPASWLSVSAGAFFFTLTIALALYYTKITVTSDEHKSIQETVSVSYDGETDQPRTVSKDTLRGHQDLLHMAGKKPQRPKN